MKTTKTLLAAIALGTSLVLGGTAAVAAGKQHNAEDINFSFEGVFGHFDRHNCSAAIWFTRKSALPVMQ